MSDRYLAIKVVMMPRDTNPQGTIFGGVILSYIDQAAAIGARHEIIQVGGRCPALVTVAMNKIEFKKPVLVGDVVSFYSSLVRIGRTSITMNVTVEAERAGGVVVPVTDAEVVYVIVEKTPSGLKPIPILPEKASSV
jgi:acyl-CoA thioesterase YciA